MFVAHCRGSPNRRSRIRKSHWSRHFESTEAQSYHGPSRGVHQAIYAGKTRSVRSLLSGSQASTARSAPAFRRGGMAGAIRMVLEPRSLLREAGVSGGGERLEYGVEVGDQVRKGLGDRFSQCRPKAWVAQAEKLPDTTAFDRTICSKNILVIQVKDITDGHQAEIDEGCLSMSRSDIFDHINGIDRDRERRVNPSPTFRDMPNVRFNRDPMRNVDVKRIALKMDYAPPDAADQ